MPKNISDQGGIFFKKQLSEQDLITANRVVKNFKIVKRSCSLIRYYRVITTGKPGFSDLPTAPQRYLTMQLIYNDFGSTQVQTCSRMGTKKLLIASFSFAKCNGIECRLKTFNEISNLLKKKLNTFELILNTY